MYIKTEPTAEAPPPSSFRAFVNESITPINVEITTNQKKAEPSDSLFRAG